VTFTGSGSRADGEIHAFEFNFGDGSATRRVDQRVGGSGSTSVVHTYENAGVYWASVRVMDNDGVWSPIPENCKARIEVTGKVLGVTPPVIPKAGFSVLGLGLVGILGVVIRVALLL
jgi:hypothetical protein